MSQIVNKDTNPSKQQYKNIVERNPITAIDVLDDKVLLKKIKDKLLITLSKFNTSRKTKITHKLISQNLISIGIFYTGRTKIPPVAIMKKNNMLYKIYLDPDAIDDTVPGKSSILIILNEIIKLNKKISKEKKFITDFQMHNIDEFQKDKEELYEDLLDGIDWLKCIDLIYFGYLQMLAVMAVDKNQSEKVKVFQVAEQLLSKQVQKIIDRMDPNILKDVEKKRLFHLGIQFFVLTYFLQISNKIAIDILQNQRGEWVNATLEDFSPVQDDKKLTTPYEKDQKKLVLAEKRDKYSEKYKKTLKDFKDIKIDSFESLAKILHNLEVANINESAFKNAYHTIVGDSVYELYYDTYPNFIALMASLNYKTQMFPKLFEVDKELQKRIEDLILNQKTHIIIKETKI